LAGSISIKLARGVRFRRFRRLIIHRPRGGDVVIQLFKENRMSDKSTYRRAPLALVLMLALAACQQQAAPPATTAAPAQPVAAAPAAVAASDSIGIAECDDFLNKYHACVDSKVPEAARAALKQSLDQTRNAWRTAMTTPGGKDTLAAACKQAHDASKASMAAYGCTDF
jgi:hypothetical protein